MYRIIYCTKLDLAYLYSLSSKIVSKGSTKYVLAEQAGGCILSKFCSLLLKYYINPSIIKFILISFSV